MVTLMTTTDSSEDDHDDVDGDLDGDVDLDVDVDDFLMMRMLIALCRSTPCRSTVQSRKTRWVLVKIMVPLLGP